MPQSPSEPTHAARTISLIVAASENNVIGVDGDLPWRLSADLKRFKKITMGHPIVMGRKTFESIGRLLPGRTSIIVTRNPDFHVEGAIVVNSIPAAIAAVDGDKTVFITGGAEIYSLAMPAINQIELTRVHTVIEGDTFLPEIDWSLWERTASVRHPADDKHSFDYSFETYRLR